MCALSGLTTGNYEGQIHVFFIILSASTLSVIYLNDLNHQKSQCHQYLVGIFLKTYRPIYISSPICFVATSKHKKGQIVRIICILITFKRCTLKVSRIKGSRFKVSRLSFSPDSRDVFLYPQCLLRLVKLSPGLFTSSLRSIIFHYFVRVLSIQWKPWNFLKKLNWFSKTKSYG